MPNLRRGMMGAAGAVSAAGGSLWGWGQNIAGAIGFGDDTNRSVPTQVGTLTDWLVPGSGYWNSFTVKGDGTLWVSGYNAKGELGLGDTTSYCSPVQVGSLTDWFHVRGGGGPTTAFTHGVKTDGTLWAWGDNDSGQLGIGDTTNRSSPVQVGSLTDWKGESDEDLAAGLPIKVGTDDQCWHIIKDDGTLWGAGANPGVGDGTGVARSSPVQIGALTTWVSISQGVTQACCYATRSDGTLWSWGVGSHGKTMHGDQTGYCSPVQVGTDTNWAHTCSGGGDNGYAMRTDGTAWGAGRNEYGELGQGNTTSYSSPVQVGSLTDWQLSFGMLYGMRCLKTDGTMWLAGYNGNGQLGDGTTTAKSSPIQVGSITNWGKLLSGSSSTKATQID